MVSFGHCFVELPFRTRRGTPKMLGMRFVVPLTSTAKRCMQIKYAGIPNAYVYNYGTPANTVSANFRVTICVLIYFGSSYDKSHAYDPPTSQAI
jgi:hypothetical protein